jgi:hypothetical protein
LKGLHTLLDQGAAHDAEFGRALSDHLPMALLALQRLGASDRQLQAYARAYPRRVGLRPARKGRWPAGNAWPARLGQRAAWPAYRDLFAQWLAHEGATDVLAQVLPALLPGVAAAAFHGLIRSASALQAGHAGELAAGLAHWAASHLALGPWPTVRATTAEPQALLRRLKVGPSNAPLIALRMADAASDGAVNRVAAALQLDATTPERLARAAALAYARTGSFTALHLVTATHAMRLVAPFASSAPDDAQPWRWHWQAFAHAVVAARLRPAAPVPLLGWDEIVARALRATDAHVIKLVDSAREEDKAYGPGDWRLAASRAVAGETGDVGTGSIT